MTASGKKIISRLNNKGSVKDTNVYKTLSEGIQSNSSDIDTPNVESLNTQNTQLSAKDLKNRQDPNSLSNVFQTPQVNNPSIQNVLNKNSNTNLTPGTPAKQEEKQKKMNELMYEQKVEAANYMEENRGKWDYVMNPHGDKTGMESFLDRAGKTIQNAFTYETDTALKTAEREKEMEYGIAKNLTAEADIAEKQWDNLFKTQDQYGPLSQATISPDVAKSISTHPNKWLNNEGNEMYMTNGKTTISKPVIKSKAYSETLNDLYNDITYEFANNGNVYSIEQIRNLYPEYYDQSDKIIRNFIEDCLYDVQQGKRRPIESYVEHYAGLSKSDGYLNKQDAIITAFTNDDNIRLSIENFASGGMELEGRTPEEIAKYVQSIYTIKNITDQYNKTGYNETNAGAYILAKTFADKNPQLKQALDYYDNFKLTTKEATIFATQYKKNKEDLQDVVDHLEGLSLDDYAEELRGMKDMYIDYIKSEVDNQINKDRSESFRLGSDNSPIGVLEGILLGDTYEDDGKLYNMDGDEVDEAWGGIGKKMIDGWVSVGQSLENISQKIDIVDNNTNLENVVSLGSEIVLTAYQTLMNSTLLGIGIQTAGTMGQEGHILEEGLMFPLEVFGSMVGGLGNLVGFTEGRKENNKELFKQAAGGLLGGLFLKNRKKIKAKWDESVIGKATKAYINELFKFVEVVDVMKLKEDIKSTTQPQLEGKTSEETTKMSQEELGQLEVEKKSFKINPEAFQNAKKAFRQTFENEYIKKQNKEGYKPTIVDRLYNKIIETRSELQKENYNNTKTEISKVKQDKVKTEQQTEQIKIPDLEKVEIIEDNVEQQAQETAQIGEVGSQTNILKKTIYGCFDLIRTLTDKKNAFLERRRKMNEEKKWESQKEAVEKIAREQYNLNPEQIDAIFNNPFGDILIEIVDAMTSLHVDEKTGKESRGPGQELSPTEIQNRVLSEGITNIQKEINNIIDLKRKIGALYDTLGKEKTIDTKGFQKSEWLTSLLDEAGLELKRTYNTDTQQTELDIRSKDGGILDEKQTQIRKYILEKLALIGEKKITEKDARALRTRFKFSDNVQGDYVKAFENSFRGAFNKYLDSIPGTEVLREIDKYYTDAFEQLESFKNMLKKDGTIKDTARTNILKMNETQIDMLDELVPGIKELVKLTKNAKPIVDALIQAKLKTKETRRLLGDAARYLFVMLPGYAGFMTGGLLGLIGGAFFFKASSKVGETLKKKIVGKKIDLSTYNQFIDQLKIEDNEKNKYKKQLLDNFEKLREQVKESKGKEYEELVNQISQILLKKEAEKISNRLKEEQRKQEYEKKIKEQQQTQEQQQTHQEQTQEQPQVEKQQTKEDDVSSFLDDMLGEEKQETAQELDYSKMSDEQLNELRENKSIPESEKSAIEKELMDRTQKEIDREAQRGNSAQATVRDEVGFIRRAHQLQEMEKNLGKVGKNKLGAEAKNKQEMEFLKKKESLITEIKEAYGLDQHDAYDKFLEFENAGLDDENYAKRGGTKNKNDYDKENSKLIKELTDKREQDNPTPITEKEQDVVQSTMFDDTKPSEKAKEIANTIENILSIGDNIEVEYATERLEERGEDVTPKNIENEKNNIKNEPNLFLQHLMGEKTTNTETKDIKTTKQEEKEPLPEKLSYDKSKTNDKMVLEVYKGKRGYDIVDTPGDEGTQFYTNDKSRANQYDLQTKNIKPEKITLAKDKVKIIDARDRTWHDEVDRDGNVIEGGYSKKGLRNYIDYNNRKAKSEGYDAVIYRGIIDLGPIYKANGKAIEDVASNVDDIVLLTDKENLTKPTKTTKPVKTNTTTQYVSEKTSNYEWKGKENMDKFEEKFGDDPDLYEEDAFGENVGISKEAKLKNHVNQTFNKIESSESAMTDDRYNEQITVATETYNTNISYKDINLKYYTTELNYRKGENAPKDAKAQFDRNNVKITIGDKKYKYTPMHELTHSLDYKFAKELGYDGTMPLSEIVMGEGFKSDNPLVNRFKALIEKINTGDPAESFAAFGEKFGERTSGKGKPNAEIQKFIDWLSDMADAREKGELEDGTLKNTEGGDVKYLRPRQVTDPQLKADIEWIRQEFGYPEELSEQTVLKKANATLPKGGDAYKLTPKQQRIYDIKNRYIKRQIEELGEKIIDFGDATITNKNNPESGKKHLFNGQSINGTTINMGGFAPHIVGQLYQDLKQDGYIVSPGQFNKRRKQKKQNGNLDTLIEN